MLKVLSKFHLSDLLENSSVKNYNTFLKISFKPEFSFYFILAEIFFEDLSFLLDLQ